MWYNNSKWRYIMRAITIDADTGKRVYTRKEVADLVGASTQSIRLWEDAGAIPVSVRVYTPVSSSCSTVTLLPS